MNGAVSGRSIYDGPRDEDEDDAPWFLRGDDDDDGEDDAAESGASAAGHGVGRGGAAGEGAETDQLAAAITALEGAEAPLLHTLARRLGRLDALVEAGAPVARLRAREIADLMWRRGRAVRAERLALYELDGGAPRGDAPADYALAFWALRRLRGGTGARRPLRGDPINEVRRQDVNLDRNSEAISVTQAPADNATVPQKLQIDPGTDAGS